MTRGRREGMVVFQTLDDSVCSECAAELGRGERIRTSCRRYASTIRPPIEL